MNLRGTNFLTISLLIEVTLMDGNYSFIKFVTCLLFDRCGRRNKNERTAPMRTRSLTCLLGNRLLQLYSSNKHKCVSTSTSITSSSSANSEPVQLYQPFTVQLLTDTLNVTRRSSFLALRDSCKRLIRTAPSLT